MNWHATRAFIRLKYYKRGLPHGEIGMAITPRDMDDQAARVLQIAKQQIYIAEGRIFKVARTHELIAEELGRHDANFRAKKHGVSRRHFYRVTAHINDAENARRQGKQVLD